MPIILKSVAPDRTESVLELVNKVLRDALVGTVDTLEGDDVAYEALKALEYLNEIEQELFDATGSRYNQDTWEEPLVAGQGDYTLPTNWQHMEADPRIVEHQLKHLTIDEWYLLANDRFTEGTPTRYILKDGKLRLWPIPSGDFLRNRCVYDDSTWYPSRTTHLAGADGETAPSAGDTTNWATDTDFDTAMDAWVAGEDDYANTDFAYQGDSDDDDDTQGVSSYVRGYMDTPYVKGLTLMAANADTPMLPAVFYPALVAGAVWRMCFHLRTDVALRQDFERRYIKLKHDRIIKVPIQDGPPNIFDKRPLA